MSMKIHGVDLNNIRLKKGTVLPSSGFYDDFTSYDTNKWEEFATSGITYSISSQNGELQLLGTSASSQSKFAGIRSKQQFPVGSKLRTRVKMTQGQHLAFGFANSNSSISGHSNSTPAVSWYMRTRDWGSYTTVGSYRDENGNTDLAYYSDIDHRTYKVLEMERVDASTVTFKVDDVLVHTTTGIVLTEDYSVFFALDSYAMPSEMFVDWVEIV